MEQDSVYDYATPIYKSLITDDVQWGIGIIPVCLISIITIVFMRLISIWCILLGIVLVIIAKIVTKKDSHLLEILFERLLLSDVYRG